MHFTSPPVPSPILPTPPLSPSLLLRAISGVLAPALALLEQSHAALLICDARCPPLHLSEALLLHARRDKELGIVLVLNKADLVPAPAVKAWTAFFEGRYPGMKVVACAANEGRAAAERILDALLETEVVFQGRRDRIRNAVGHSRDEILEAS
eukprot:CAMPEP_0175064998 /NCGR_PEP_ID=MMETSP0052_2-20121109/15661_1 /TAXON_ID=51329 ORGANISM="Polytomella parva, Strain SAG 63-3" /NCGR_SAMPLE_ID=MMETSP0052_2 /ASSEMBLY_ACC=CAM_ASM_000194 /LENGTH=152 /DNA_ID=CAMNT_0016331445 /DNA_START=110 /DNA_END=565 /DNA_ORIENTATION=-